MPARVRTWLRLPHARASCSHRAGNSARLAPPQFVHMSTIARTNSLRSPCFLWHLRGSLQPLRARLCATDASGRLTIGAALRHAVVPERDLLGALFWRAIRLARIAVLTGTVYGAGKSAGHIEILDDPKGIAKAIVRQVIIQSHVPDEENPEPAGYLTKEMPERQRVEAVGKRVLFAAREEVEAELAKLGPAPEEPVDPHEHRRAELEAAKARLAGKWYWVVTNSSNVNGYVTAMCPRRVFITQGLFKKLKPTDDELAFLIGHELGVSRFGAPIPD